MRLKNKKTGEIIEFDALLAVRDTKNDSVAHLEYDSLGDFFAEWEDVPKEYWFIDAYGNIVQNKITEHKDDTDDSYIDMTDLYESQKSIGNYFDTGEEAEKAVEKLKAIKRLRDKGFEFEGWEDLEAIELPIKGLNNIVGFRLEDNHDVVQDLQLLFGGEE